MEVKGKEFVNLKQGKMSVKEYGPKFTQLSRYAPELVSNMRSKMRKFVSRIFDEVALECRATLLNNHMDISRLMVYAQQVEEEKKKRAFNEERLGKKARHPKHDIQHQDSGRRWDRFSQRKSWGLAHSSASAPAPRPTSDQSAQSNQNCRMQGNQSQRGRA